MYFYEIHMVFGEPGEEIKKQKNGQIFPKPTT